MDENTGFYFWKRIDEIKGSMSIKDISELSMIPYGTLKNQRSRNIIPKMEDVFTISKVLDVSMDTLMPNKDASFQTERALAKEFWIRTYNAIKEKGRNIKDVFGSIDVDSDKAYQWSIRQQVPPITTIILLSDILDVDIHWLVWGNEVPNRDVALKKLINSKDEISVLGAKLREKDEQIRQMQEELDRLKEER